MRTVLMAGITAVGIILCSCGVSSPSHPGPEKTEGRILQFDRDQHGEWSAEKRYSEQQRDELDDYELDRRMDALFYDEYD
jgi:hypothetical protein